MSKDHPGELHLHRGPFSGQWFAVRVGRDGVTISDRWKIAGDDSAALERFYQENINKE